MTVSSVYEPVQYTGNGVTTAFSFPYIFYDDTDIIVTLTLISTGVDTVQTNPTNYTITGGDGATGTINFVVAPSALYRVTIERSIPYTQEDNYVEGQAFPASTIETAFDRGVMRDQQINATLERVLKYPATDSNTLNGELPSAVDRASKVLAFDSNGDPTVVSTDSDNVIAAEAAATAAEAAQAAAEAAAAMLPLNNYTATSPPTVNDDSADGYSVGSRWVDTTGDLEAWTCASASVGAAQWLPTTLTVDDLGSLAVLNEVAYANIASAAIATVSDITSSVASKLVNAVILKSWWDALADTPDFTSSAQTVTYNSSITVAHGLGVAPSRVELWLNHTASSNGWVSGDTTLCPPICNSSGNYYGAQVIIDTGNTTQVRVTTGVGIALVHKTTGAGYLPIAGNLTYTIKAWK